MDRDFNLLEQFLALSVVLTGFKKVDLLGTGVAPQYYDEVVKIVGKTICNELLTKFQKIAKRAGGNPGRLERAVRKQILQDAQLGPLARNIIKMWYLGNWSQMPEDWRKKQNGGNPLDANHVVSAQAYQEGLVWRVIGSHPPGAKQPGYATWSQPPKIQPR
jgi:hypothetical protein